MASNKEKINEEELKIALSKIKTWKQQGRRILIDEYGIEFIKRNFLEIPIISECPLWRTDLYVESNGNIRTGCWFLQEVGNIRKESLKGIINNSLYQKNINNMIHRKCNGCTCGYLMQARYLDKR